MNLPFRKPDPASNQAFTIPRLEDVSLLYSELIQKLAAINVESSQLETQRQEMITRWRNSRSTDPSTGKRASTEQDRRVAEILGDTVPAATKELVLSEEIAAVDKRLGDLAAAGRLLRERLGTERIKASAIICQQIEPHYRAMMTELAGRMCELAHAAVRYREFAVRLNDMDVAWARLDPMSQDVGGAANKAGPFRAWLGGAMSRGFGKLTDLPEVMR